MDDKRFDEVIKSKVGEYVDPHFDTGALTGLHQLIASAHTLPWYVQYKIPLLTAGVLAVFTFFNWWFIQDFTTDSNQLNDLSINEEIGKHEDLIADLREEIDRLKEVQPDTIYVSSAMITPPVRAEERDPLLNEEDIISAFLAQIGEGGRVGRIGNYYFFHGSELPTYGELVSIVSKQTEMSGSQLAMSYPKEDTLWQEFEIAPEPSDPGQMPVLLIRDLEKHYSKGIGLKVGLHGEFAFSQPDLGTGEGLPGIGLHAEMVFSPSIGLETGLTYKNRSYVVNDPTAQVLAGYPDVNGDLGPVQSIEADSRLIAIPINFKYYYPIRQNSDVYFMLGLSPNLYFSQAFEYSHDEVPQLPPDFTLNNTVTKNSFKFYPGTVNVGTGISVDLKNRRIVQLGVFYQRSLQRLGLEDRSLNIYGLRGSYWLRLR